MFVTSFPGILLPLLAVFPLEGKLKAQFSRNRPLEKATYSYCALKPMEDSADTQFSFPFLISNHLSPEYSR